NLSTNIQPASSIPPSSARRSLRHEGKVGAWLSHNSTMLLNIFPLLGRGAGEGLGTLDLELGTLYGHAICYCRLFSALTRQPCTRCAKSPDFERHFVLLAIGSFNKHSTRIINPS